MSSEHLIADAAANRILAYADTEIAALSESLQEDALNTVQQQIGIWLERLAFRPRNET